MTATCATEYVNQTVNLTCGHQHTYQVPRPVAESGFARSGVAWRCVACDSTGDMKHPIATVHNEPTA